VFDLLGVKCEKMKSWILAIVAIAAVVLSTFADSECYKHEGSCAAEGDKCVGDFLQNETGCINNTKCCARPLYCVKGKCVEDTRDKNCTHDDDCKGAFYGSGIITCIKGKCIVQGSFNDSCMKDDHCAGDQKCVKEQCDGLALNAKCDAEKGFQCGANKTCYKGVCIAALAEGDKCETSDQCDVYSICNDGKCIMPYSLKKDAKCTDLDRACGKGLYCLDAEKKCKETIKRKHIVCTSDSDCTDYGNTSTCSMCDAVTGEMYCSDPTDVERDCIAEMAAAIKCYKKNGCAPVFSSSLDTCAQLECTAETNAVFACQSRCEDLKSVAGKKCLSGLMLRYCPLLPTWLRIVIAFSILVVIIVVVFIIYAIYNCTRKGDGYSPVDDEEDKTPN